MSSQITSMVQTKRQSCGRCLRPSTVCFCNRIVHRCNNWPIYVLQDIREARHAIGTARIAALSLSQCTLVAVDPDQPEPSPELMMLQSLQPALIYPGGGVSEVCELRELSPRPLMFIDASWRRSRKILHMMPWIQRLPRFTLSSVPASRYRIRQQPFPEALSTLEAIVYTLQSLEPVPSRYDSLLTTMDWVVDQQIQAMGSHTWQTNYLNKTTRS